MVTQAVREKELNTKKKKNIVKCNMTLMLLHSQYERTFMRTLGDSNQLNGRSSFYLCNLIRYRVLRFVRLHILLMPSDSMIRVSGITEEKHSMTK